MIALLLLCALAVDPADNMAQLDQLVELRQCVEAVQKLEKHGVQVDKTIVPGLLQEAETATAGKVTTWEQLQAITGGGDTPPSAEEKHWGFLTFVNIIWITAALLGVGAVVWLFGIYLLALIIAIPAQVWELICYGVCAFLIFLGARIADPNMVLMPVLPGCIGLLGCIALTKFVHFDNQDILRPASWFLTVVWAIVAVMYGSHVIGFMAVMALLSALGFIMGMIPGVLWMGFDDDKLIPRTTIAAGFITLFYLAIQICGISDPRVLLFKEGAMVCGTFVYFIGMLIWSSKWMCYEFGPFDGHSNHGLNFLRYLALQVAMIASGVAALYIGSVFQIGFLLGMGGTVFYIYLLEKYYEIPWEGAGWAWSTLGLAGILYAFAAFAKANPTYFFW